MLFLSSLSAHLHDLFCHYLTQEGRSAKMNTYFIQVKTRKLFYFLHTLKLMHAGSTPLICSLCFSSFVFLTFSSFSLKNLGFPFVLFFFLFNHLKSDNSFVEWDSLSFKYNSRARILSRVRHSWLMSQLSPLPPPSPPPPPPVSFSSHCSSISSSQSWWLWSWSRNLLCGFELNAVAKWV